MGTPVSRTLQLWENRHLEDLLSTLSCPCGRGRWRWLAWGCHRRHPARGRRSSSQDVQHPAGRGPLPHSKRAKDLWMVRTTTWVRLHQPELEILNPLSCNQLQEKSFGVKTKNRPYHFVVKEESYIFLRWLAWLVKIQAFSPITYLENPPWLCDLWNTRILAFIVPSG